MKKERFEAITDAILAIIATLMIMEIHLPALAGESIHRFLFQIFIYVISFVSIVILWLNHHEMFKNVEYVNNRTVWINFFLLFATSLIPLATGMLDEDYFNYKSHIFYGATLGITTFFYTILEEMAKRISPDEHRNKLIRANWAATGLYLLAMPLSLISVYISAAIFILIPAFYFLLPQQYGQRESRQS